MTKVDVLERRIVFDDFFKIEAATVRFLRFDGHMSEPVRRLNFLRGDSAAAVLYNQDEDSVVLVNQFKYPASAHGSGWIIELVAGIVGEEEDPKEAISREILEETGYSPKSLTHLTTFFVSPGGSSERIWLYLARVDAESQVAPGGGVSDEQEDIEVLEMSLSEAWKAVRRGDIADAKTVVGLMWLAASRYESWTP